MNKTERHLNEVRMMSIADVEEYLGLGVSSAKKLMQEIGAERRFGACVRYDRKKIDEYFDEKNQSKTNNDYEDSIYLSGLVEGFETVREIAVNESLRICMFANYSIDEILTEFPITEIMKRVQDWKNIAEKDELKEGEVVTFLNPLNGEAQKVRIVCKDDKGRYVFEQASSDSESSRTVRIRV